MLVGLVSLFIIILYSHRSHVYVRINVGLGLLTLALLIVPIIDAVYIKGRVGLFDGFYVTVGAVGLSALGKALVEGGIVGSAGELPDRHMQATIAGTSASGVLIPFLRIFMKAVYAQDAAGLRKSANLYLYFSVGIVVMFICMVLYNVGHKLPVIKYYSELKFVAVNEDEDVQGPLTGSVWRATLGEIVGRVKWYGFGIVFIYYDSFHISRVHYRGCELSTSQGLISDSPYYMLQCV